MAKSFQLKFAVAMCWFFAAMSVSAIVYAAEKDPIANGIESIPFGEIKYVWPVILCGGLLAVLMKMADLNRPQFRSTSLEVAKDLMGSFCAGSLMFLAASWIDTSVYSFDIKGRFVAIFFAAFGGAKLIQIVYTEGFVSWGKRMLKKFFGADPAPASPNRNQEP